MSTETVYVSGMGEAFIPQKYYTHLYRCSPLRMFDLCRDDYSKAFKFLKNGGAIILSGNWEDVLSLGEYVEGRESELLRTAKDKKHRLELSAQLRQRILVPLECTPVKDGVDDSRIIASLVGEKAMPSQIPVLVPVYEADRLAKGLNIPFPVEPAGFSVRTHPDVLIPRSKETIALMCKAIQFCKDGMPDNPKILDMGCGSGVLTIAAWQILKGRQPCIAATDILPEAVAVTRLNVKHLGAMNGIDCAAITVTDSGDMFNLLSDAKYDLIIFNAPWINAPAKNKSELALNDEGQKTIKRFLDECVCHLLPDGRVIVGYSDNCGAKAIDNLEGFISGAGLRIIDILKDRIKTYSSNKPWQSIFAYILAR